MKTKQTSLTDQLRQLIEDAEITRYQLWQQTGIDQAVLSKFVNGKGGLSMESLDKIGELLNLQITTKPSPAKGRKGK
jgi:DNA transposition AAA+ family ATPase